TLDGASAEPHTRTACRDARLNMGAGDYARQAEDPDGECRSLPLASADQAHSGATQISHRDAGPETTGIEGRAGSETELVPARDPARLQIPVRHFRVSVERVHKGGMPAPSSAWRPLLLGGAWIGGAWTGGCTSGGTSD